MRSASPHVLSVVVPTRERPDSLARLLNALCAQDTTESWELIVVDNGPTSATARVVQLFKGRLESRYLEESRPGAAVARNTGLRAADGEFVIFLDDDMRPEPHLLRRHLNAAQKYGSWVVGGCPPTTPIDGPFQRYAIQLHSAGRSDWPSEARMYTSQNVIVRRSELLALGGYDERFPAASCEDADVFVRASNAGIRVVSDESIVAFHEDWSITSFAAFCERQRLYGQSAPLLDHIHGVKNPQHELAVANAPIDWHSDTGRLLVRKAMKTALSARPVRGAIEMVAGAVEFGWPRAPFLPRFYRIGLAAAIARGVREGHVMLQGQVSREDGVADDDAPTDNWGVVRYRAGKESCPLCGEVRQRGRTWTGITVFRSEEYSYVTCEKCLTIRCSPMPGNAVLQMMYGDDYALLVGSDHEVEDPKRPERVLQKLNTMTPGRFLDFGCGTGELLTRARDLGWESVGVEFSEEVAKSISAATGAEVVSVEHVGELPPQDVLHFGDVIEHLTNLEDQFRAALLRGRPGTVVIAQGPLENNLTLFNVARRIAGSLRANRRRQGLPTHVILATAKGQREFFRRAGLKEHTFDVWEVRWPAPARMSSDLIRRPRLLALYVIRSISMRVGRLAPKKWGDRYFYVGTIPETGA